MRKAIRSVESKTGMPTAASSSAGVKRSSGPARSTSSVTAPRRPLARLRFSSASASATVPRSAVRARQPVSMSPSVFSERMRAIAVVPLTSVISRRPSGVSLPSPLLPSGYTVYAAPTRRPCSAPAPSVTLVRWRAVTVTYGAGANSVSPNSMRSCAPSICGC